MLETRAPSNGCLPERLRTSSLPGCGAAASATIDVTWRPLRSNIEAARCCRRRASSAGSAPRADRRPRSRRRDDDVAGLQACLPRRVRCWRRARRRRRRCGRAQSFGHLARHGLELGAEPRPLDLAAGDGTVDDRGARGWRGWRSRCRASRRICEKIIVLMPTRRAGHVDQRAAGVAGIDGGVGLDEDLAVGLCRSRCGPARR